MANIKSITVTLDDGRKFAITERTDGLSCSVCDLKHECGYQCIIEDYIPKHYKRILKEEKSNG